jgi:chromosomal replication initiation ATPase DnaA
MRPEEAWQSVLSEIELGMGRSGYVTWLKSAKLVTYEDGQFIVGVANGYVKEWIEQRKLTEIKKMLAERMGLGVDVSFVVVSNVHALCHAQLSSES